MSTREEFDEVGAAWWHLTDLEQRKILKIVRSSYWPMRKLGEKLAQQVPAVNDDELLDSCFRMDFTFEQIRIRIFRVDWRGPHERRENWESAVVIDVGISDEELEAKKRELLLDPKYFGYCFECHRRKPRGYMMESGGCMACAEAGGRVIF